MPKKVHFNTDPNDTSEKVTVETTLFDGTDAPAIKRVLDPSAPQTMPKKVIPKEKNSTESFKIAHQHIDYKTEEAPLEKKLFNNEPVTYNNEEKQEVIVNKIEITEPARPTISYRAQFEAIDKIISGLYEKALLMNQTDSASVEKKAAINALVDYLCTRKTEFNTKPQNKQAFVSYFSDCMAHMEEKRKELAKFRDHHWYLKLIAPFRAIYNAFVPEDKRIKTTSESIIDAHKTTLNQYKTNSIEHNQQSNDAALNMSKELPEHK